MSQYFPEYIDPFAYEEPMGPTAIARAVVLSIGIVAFRKQLAIDLESLDPEIIEGEIVETQQGPNQITDKI